MKIKRLNFYNNAQSLLNVQFEDGSVKTFHVTDSDKRAYLSRKITITELSLNYL